MSATRASSTDWVGVHVRFLGPAVDVWRPVPTPELGEPVYRLARAPAPLDDAGAWRPAEEVVFKHHLTEGRDVMVAAARVVDVDQRSRRWLRKAG